MLVFSHVSTYCRGLLSVPYYPLPQTSLSFPNVGSWAIIAPCFVDYTKQIDLISLVLGGHKFLPKGVDRVGVDLNASFPDGSVECP